MLVYRCNRCGLEKNTAVDQQSDWNWDATQLSFDWCQMSSAWEMWVNNVGPWIEYTPWEPCEFMSIPRELNCQEVCTLIYRCLRSSSEMRWRLSLRNGIHLTSIPGDVSKPTTLSSKISHICVSELSTQRCQTLIWDERWGVTEMLHEWEPPIHFWLGARSRALSRIGRLDELWTWDIQIKIRRWYTLTNNSFLRGFDLIYTILLFTFQP